MPLLLINLNENIKIRFNNQFINAITDKGLENFYYNSQYRSLWHWD